MLVLLLQLHTGPEASSSVVVAAVAAAELVVVSVREVVSVSLNAQRLDALTRPSAHTPHTVSQYYTTFHKTSPFSFLRCLCQMSTDFANFCQKHT